MVFFTKHGGQHVDGWTKPFFANLLSVLNKPSKTYKDLKLSLKDVTPYFRFFVKSTVDKPQFDCQNKKYVKVSMFKIYNS